MLERLLPVVIRHTARPLFHERVPVRLTRPLLTLLTRSASLVHGTRFVPARAGSVPSELVVPKRGGTSTRLLFLHGGAFRQGSPFMYRPLTSAIARHTGATLTVPDYRLAPEHPHPAAADDAFASYRALLEEGVHPRRIVIGGDSAGAGLALSTAIRIRDAGLPAPAGLVLISPWLDLSLSGASVEDLGARDPMLDPRGLAHAALEYRGTTPADDPSVSPLFARLDGLPPMLVQVGSEEILLDDSRRLETRTKAAGGTITLRVFDGLWHDFQMQAGLLPAADRALAEIATFVASVTSAG